MRAKFLKFFLDLLTDIKCIDKRCYAFNCHRSVYASELFECLVRLGVTFTAQYSLNALGNDIPHIVKVAVDSIDIKQQFIEALKR